MTSPRIDSAGPVPLDDRSVLTVSSRRRFGARAGGGPAGLLGLRDMQWRLRRILVTVFATGLVFALALMMTGISASFDNEVDRTVASMHADEWLVARGSIGPFTAPAAFPQASVAAVRALPGVRRADPIAVVSATTTTPSTRSLGVIGVVPGGVGAPAGAASQALARGDAVVDGSLGLGLGDRVDLNGIPYRVGALTDGLTYFGGQPTVKIALPQAQRLRFAGQPLATTILTQGVPTVVPAQFTLLSNDQVKTDLVRPVSQAKQTISIVRTLLWIVAAGIIGAVLYLSALERAVDFAALKAIGVSTRSLVASLLVQALALALASAVVAFGLEALIATTSAMSVEVPAAGYLTLAVVAVVAGTIASMVALRRAVKVDPALAF